ncbi:MAG: HD domain-containing protein [Clostridiales bacterium]|nr:HD domain-containing protein [Clostridiales bacterium]
MISSLIDEMIAYDKGDPRRIQHFIKVHDFARTIGQLEGMDDDTLYIVESAAVVHDIGIHVCEEKYGSCEGKLQEKEGPALAKEMLERLGYEHEVIDRVCYLVGHHHTYTNIDGVDYQILVEADFLVNLYEDEVSSDAVRKAYQNIFKTESGRKICRNMFGL